MNDLSSLTADISRLVVPFLDIFTTVYVVKTPDGALLFDTATYATDIDDYIVPMLNELGIDADSLKYVLISHSHRDHAGGLERFMQLYPKTCIISKSSALREKFAGFDTFAPDDGSTVLDILKIVTVPGHSGDCISLLDTRTKTLLTGDCLQLYGIYGSGFWGANIGAPVDHLAAIEKLRGLDVETVAASHDYHPCGHIACGNDEISRYYDECANALYAIRDAIKASGSTDMAELSQKYNETSGLPKVSERIFTSILKAMEAGNI